MSIGISYRSRFQRREDATQYDVDVYRNGTVHDLLWQTECPILERVVTRLRDRLGHLDYLDFACGTGRILSHLEPLVDKATGLDVSQAMLERAAKKVDQAQLICGDISQSDELLDRKYDLITAFRFLTNAEPELRRTVLERLVSKLKGPDSLLLVNIHANPLSYKAAMVPYHWVRSLLQTSPWQNNLSRAQTVAELKQAGLQVQSVIGMGFVSGKLVPFAKFDSLVKLERGLAGMPGLQRFGVNQLFVCRRT